MTKKIHQDGHAIREAVGMFDDVDAVYDCIDDLQSHGFDRSDITMLSKPEVIGTPSTLPIIDTLQTEDSQTTLRGPIVELESVGDAQGAALGIPIYVFTLCGAGLSSAFGLSTPLLLTVSGIAGLIGTALGVAIVYLMRRRQDQYYRRQLEHGGIPLWIHIRDAIHEKQALETLTHNHAHDVHIHDLPGLPYEVDEGRPKAFQILH